MLAVETTFLSHLLDFKIESLDICSLIHLYLIHIAKIYLIPSMCEALCPSRRPWGAHHAALLTAGLWLSLALHWPAASVCGFDCFFLSDSQQRAVAHGGFSKNIHFPLVLTSH